MAALRDHEGSIRLLVKAKANVDKADIVRCLRARARLWGHTQCVCVCVCVCIYIHTHTLVLLETFIQAHINNKCLHMYVCMYIYICVCVCIYIYICVCVHRYIYT